VLHVVVFDIIVENEDILVGAAIFWTTWSPPKSVIPL